MLRSWLPPDARDRHALGVAAPHRRCRLFGYHQMPNAATHVAPQLSTGDAASWLPPDAEQHNATSGCEAAPKTKIHPCASEMITEGSLSRPAPESQVFFASCIVCYLAGRQKRDTGSLGLRYVLNAPPKTRRRAPLRPGPPATESSGKGSLVLYGGPNENIKVGQIQLTNALAGRPLPTRFGCAYRSVHFGPYPRDPPASTSHCPAIHRPPGRIGERGPVWVTIWGV